MILDVALCRAALRGAKTQIRRPVRRGETWASRVGRLIPIHPGYGEPMAGRVLLTDVRREHLRDVTVDGAQAEGFKTVEEFRAAWCERWGTWVPERQVWVLVIRPHAESGFLTPATGRRRDQSDYTHTGDPLDAGEVVDYAALERYATDAAMARREEHLRRRARSLARRVREETLALGRAGVDVTQELDAIEAQLAAMERKRGMAA